MTAGYETKVARSIEEVEALRSIWQGMQFHPNTDIDYYLAVVGTKEKILKPHVILLSKNGAPEALAIGRLETRNIGITIGYKSLFKLEVPCLTILYNGLLGNWSNETSNALISELIGSLRRREADLAWLNLLRSDSQIYGLARSKPNLLCRDHIVETNTHWKMTLPGSLDEFLQGMTAKHRYWLKRLPKVIEKDFAGKVSYEYYRSPGKLERLFTDAEEIAQKTYQRDLNAGFMDNHEMRRRLALSAEKGWLRSYLLYIDEKPCAFWIGTLYGNTFHLDFTGYDPSYKRYEPGTILFMKMLEDLAQNKVKEMDFGSGDAQYKQRFGDYHWNESSVFIYAPTIKGVFLKAIRFSNTALHEYAVKFAAKTNILQKTKRLWRDKLIKGKIESGNDQQT